MIKYAKKCLSLFLSLTLFGSFALAAAAQNVPEEDLTNPDLFVGQGGLEPGEHNMTDEKFMQVALAQPGVTPEDAQKIVEKYAWAEEARAKGRSVPLPGYAWLVTPIMQEDPVWCSAATIQQTLRFINGSVPASQANIMNAVGGGPGMQTVLNYINARLPAPYSDYVRRLVYNKDDFDTTLLFGLNNKQPMVFTLANSDKTYNIWLYTTGGHFTNCDGYVPGQGYLFSDPYFFQHYVGSIAADNNGYLYRSWEQLWDANTQLFSPDQNAVGY